MTIEELVFKYGEDNRKIITNAITWLQVTEPGWNLETTIDRDKLIHTLIQHKAKP